MIDTSVLVSAIITPSGPNAQIFALIAADEIRPYERLKHLSRVRIASFRGLREKTATKVKTGGRLKISGHEEDNRIYECALAAKADYIITENARHFQRPYKTTGIVNARQLLKLLETGQA
ncbi:MAG: putative toxin-antitoxin system toxin component, PIN family [Bryobacteraceae bacterium]